MQIGLPQMICAELVWSGSVHHWLGENCSNLLAVEINGRGSLYYKQNALSEARSVQPKRRFLRHHMAIWTG